MISTRTLAVASVFLFLFIIGFVLMGYEMLGSRYLNPHFGGGITTWAGLISIVLLAMMVGYMTGGYLVDSRPNIDLLSIICVLSGLSIIIMPTIEKPMLTFILNTFGDQLTGVLIASAAISFIPVALLSASSPFVVRLLLQDLKTGGQTAGWVYSVSTLGNVFGTLVTTFSFIPHFGTRTITFYFGLTLIILSIIIYLFRNRITFGLTRNSLSTASMIALAIILLPTELKALPKPIEAHYPEGPISLKGKLYYAEMTAHRVSVVEKGKAKTFWSEQGCGPTSISPYKRDNLLILCHLQAKLVILSSKGKKVGEINIHRNRKLFQDPNDSHGDGNSGVFFSDAGLFLKGAKATGIVYHISAKGQLRQIATKLSYANGIAYDNKKRILYVSEHLAGKAWAYYLAPDFSVIKRNVILDISKIWKKSEIDYAETGPDGIELLKDGSIAIAIYGKGTVVILKDNKLQKIPVSTKFVTNIAEHNNMLAITGAHNNQVHPYKGKVKFLTYDKRK